MNKTTTFNIFGALHWAVVGCGILTASSKAAEPTFWKLTPVPFTQVQIQDAFWSPRQDTNRNTSIPHNLDMLVKVGNLKNFELAAAGERKGYSGPVFMDSDLYKGLEAAAYVLATHPDANLDKRMDEFISKIAAAQRPDGYINTHFQVNAPDQRWKNLRDWHELYCAGHMFEAAVAHYQATGKRNFLDVAIRFANYIDSVFGSGEGKRMGYPGHPEIELALVKMANITGDQKYFNLSRFFIENRGIRFFATEHNTPLDKYQGDYWQDDVPIREHRQIKGHAVRAAYLLSGVVDISTVTEDAGLLAMVDRVWRNTTTKRMYITGGIGPSAHNEGFTVDYDLPNATAYQETCASVAMALWNHRLNLLYGDSKYADLVEKTLYNGILAGVSLDGTSFFYVNPLSSQGSHHRSGWFGCACCPPNVARTVASLGGYAYAATDKALWINLYVQGSVKAEFGGKKALFKIQTDYPWDGKVVIQPELASPMNLELRLRVPGWCSGATVKINGQDTKARKAKGYLVLESEWKSGDQVELNLPMPVQRMMANPMVKEDVGLCALQRGPIVYCLEACDHSVALSEVAIPLEAKFKVEKRSDLLGGVVALTTTGLAASEQEWAGKLYQPLKAPRRVPITAIPYYAWDNRQAGSMMVWLPSTPPPVKNVGLEGKAKVTVSFANSNCQPEGIHDGVEPKSSGEQPAANCHWWPHKGSQEWVQYTFAKPIRVAGAKVYWFDDTGRGACRLPDSWEISYLDGTEWKPVETASPYAIAKDKWCEVSFKTVQTQSLKLSLKLKPEWAAGIHEWKLMTPEDME